MSMLVLAPAFLLMARPAPAAEPDAARQIAEACADRRVEVRLSDPAPGGDAAGDRRAADRFLGMRSLIDDDAPGGPTLKWDRGRRGEAECRTKLAELEARYPGRVHYPRLERKRYAEAGKRMEGQVPAGVRKDPRDASLQARLFDASRSLGASEAATVSVPGTGSAARFDPGRPLPPRAAMPASFTRPYAEPPEPGVADLQAAAQAAFSGVSGRVRRGGMAIDTDGDLRGGNPALAALARRDPDRQGETAFKTGDGRSLDPTRVPFVVVPKGSGLARLGDRVLVSYGGRSVLAVVGDVGPRNKFGEGSMALASALGISPDGVRGGVEGGVTYTFLGSGSGRAATQESLLAQLTSAQTSLASR